MFRRGHLNRINFTQYSRCKRNCFGTPGLRAAYQLFLITGWLTRTRGESRNLWCTEFYLGLWRMDDSRRTAYARRYERIRPPPLRVKVIRVLFALRLSDRCIIFSFLSHCSFAFRSFIEIHPLFLPIPFIVRYSAVCRITSFDASYRAAITLLKSMIHFISNSILNFSWLALNPCI